MSFMLASPGGGNTPQRRLTNYDLEQMVDTSDEWISSRTGIRERRIAAPEETTVSMALEASHAALDRAGIRSEDLDLIILATSSPDYLCPAGASILQDRLGANNAGAFDLTAGCTGFVYGLVTATQFIKTGAYRRILVVGAEKLSMAVDWTDRETCVLFGDGAGAVVVEASNSPTGVMAFELGSEGAAWDALVVPGGGSANPMSQGVIDRKENYLRMDGKRVFKFATRTMSRSVQNVVRASGVPFDEVDFIVPHQANAHHRDGSQAPEGKSRQGDGKSGPLRQHLGSVDSYRPVRSCRPGQDSGRQPYRAGWFRRWPDLGIGCHPLGARTNRRRGVDPGG